MRDIAVGAVLVVAVGGAAERMLAAAHHSNAQYVNDSSQIEGTVVEYQFKNPHSAIVVIGTLAGSRQRRMYVAEWISTSQLIRAGIDRSFVRPGDGVRLWVALNKTGGDCHVMLRRIRRKSDGREWAISPVEPR